MNPIFDLYRILGVWQGSLYKGIWKDLLIYCLLYALISIIYRLFGVIIIFDIIIITQPASWLVKSESCNDCLCVCVCLYACPPHLK